MGSGHLQPSMDTAQVFKSVMVVLVGMVTLLEKVVGQEIEGSAIGLPAGHQDVLTRSYNPESFSCEGQDYGYFADVESGCEIFHICLPMQDNDGVVTSTAKYSFFCGNGTVFDQQALVCNHADDAFPCEESPSLYGSVPFGEVLQDY